jgi:2-desacetyl-2-hydroxyethyl bacteriochlorophyllide A dehydrogenase
MGVAVVAEAPGRVVVEERPADEPTQGQVLIRTSASLISSGTELTALLGKEPAGTLWAGGSFPYDTGYSNVGRVVDVGPGVDQSWIGRRVGSYRPHASYVLESADQVRPVHRDEVGDDQATFFILAETVMNGLRRGRVQFGESVVVFGLGILGQLAARLCLLVGADKVIVVDTADRRLALAPSDPRIVAVNPGRDRVVEVVTDHTRGRMADLAIELTGDPNVIPSEIATLHDEGRLVILSSPRGSGTVFNFHDLCNWPSHSIIGAHFRSHPERPTPANPWTHGRHSELFFDVVAEGRLDIASMITHRYPCREAPAAYEMLMEDRSAALGVVLEW